MVLKSFIDRVTGSFRGGKGTEPPTTVNRFPPVPEWRPSFSHPLDQVTDRISYYTNGQRDFVVFANGTCVILEPDLSDADAEAYALATLSKILHSHPDMTPTPMDDGNILVRYGQPAVNVVLSDVAKANWSEVERCHIDGLTPSEVLITPLGSNKFDDFGKQALLGRAYMFMDAQDPAIAEIKRHN